MNEYGIGLTTYRDKKSENINKTVYTNVKRGRFFEASKIVNKVVRDKINWLPVSDYRGYPAVGVYEGGKEPSAHVYVSTDNKKALISQLQGFRKETKQDSILLYQFVKSNGVPILEINGIVSAEISKIQKDIIKATNGKVGGYLTYIYAMKKIVIVNVKEFDDLTSAQFRTYIPKIKSAVSSYGGKVTVKQVKVTVI